MSGLRGVVGAWVGGWLLVGCGGPSPGPATADPLRAELDALVAARALLPIPPPPVAAAADVALGRALFYDPLLSGPRSHACASCHHPEHQGVDGLPVFVGPGGVGFGPERALGDAPSVGTRNTPALLNMEGRTHQTWDGHIAGEPGSWAFVPPGVELEAGIDNLLALSVLRPMTVADEMKGYAGVPDALGGVNELAELGDPESIWYALLARMEAEPGYDELLAAAEPGERGYATLGNALSAFIATTLRADDTPWDRYLRGDEGADVFGDAAVRGALLFFGAAQCQRCHDGPWLSDSSGHNAAAPQLGLGRGDFEPWDPGAFAENRDDDSLWWVFQTPPLRNVEVTGPWTHAGGYGDLQDVVRHFLDPVAALAAWDPSWMRPEWAATARQEPDVLAEILGGLAPALDQRIELTDEQVADLVAFLTEALTDPRTADPDHFAPPDTVPSGLPLAL